MKHRRDIVFSKVHSTTANEELFIQHDNGNVDDRIVIFSTRGNFQVLSKCQHWFADGSFQIAPFLFEQIYTIHSLDDNISLPLVYALLPNKEENTYVSFLKQLKSFISPFAPKYFTLDFEYRMMNACRRVFPNTTLRGCFFHLTQDILRQIEYCNLIKRFENDVNFELKFKMLAALAFVPADNVEATFNYLYENDLLTDEESQSIFDYFEDAWIGRPTIKNFRRPPKYLHEVWNMHQLVLSGEIKLEKQLKN